MAPWAPRGRDAVRPPVFAMTSAALRAGPVLQGALCWAVGLGRGPQGCGALCSRHLGAHAPNEAAPWDADLAHLAAV